MVLSLFSGFDLLQWFGKAYSYAQKGVQEEADYPWGWLNLAKLQYHFGEKEKVMASIEKGLSLVPDDYEFKVLQEEIKANCSLEEMLCHYIKPEDDAFLKIDKCINSI